MSVTPLKLQSQVKSITKFEFISALIFSSIPQCFKSLRAALSQKKVAFRRQCFLGTANSLSWALLVRKTC